MSQMYLQAAVSVLSACMAVPQLIPGAGSTEFWIASHIRARASKILNQEDPSLEDRMPAIELTNSIEVK